MNEAFKVFRDLVLEGSPKMNYSWSSWKEESCKWIMERIQSPSKVLEVGGTEWLCNKLAEKGCEVTYYDLEKPASFENYIQADMMDVLSHFNEASFDVITTRHTLEHSLAPLYQLWCYNKLLVDRGKLIVIVPVHIREWVWFGTHHSCLPLDNWIMLFYRSGFRIKCADAGTWGPNDSKFIEHRFELELESRELRLKFEPKWLPF